MDKQTENHILTNRWLKEMTDPEMATVIGGGIVAGDPNLLKKIRIPRK